MQSAFQHWLQHSGHSFEGETVLLAVSGGVDSMVMLDLFCKAKISCAVAHVNFGLRGAESDGDEQLVRDVAEVNSLPLHVLSADTLKAAEEANVSIQMAARDLRYGFFKDICKAHGYSHVVTAHHANDNLEHFFIYLLRNNAHAAFRGIDAERDGLLRPLLQVSRCDILDYAKANNLQWREDSSNEKTDYLRNKIRHLIMPGLQHEFETVLEEYRELNEAYRDWYGQKQKKSEHRLQQLTEERGDVEVLLGSPNDYSLWPAYENKLRSMGFTRSQISDMKTAAVGSEFYSPFRQIRKTAGGLHIKSIDTSIGNYEIEINEVEGQTIRAGTFEIRFERIESVPEQFETGAYYFDYHELQFPLLLRNWRVGDRMQPFGVDGSQKLSDVFTNAKIAGDHRLNYPVLEDGNGILAVVGLRRGSGAVVSAETKSMLKLSYSEQ